VNILAEVTAEVDQRGYSQSAAASAVFLVLRPLLLNSRSGVLVVIVLRRNRLALPTTALLGSGRGRGRSIGLATSVRDLLQSVIGADSEAFDGLGAELAGGLVVVDLFRLSVVKVE
jgi:hypothetical protein